MARMIRKQVYIRSEQEKTLKRLARELSVSETEILRMGIDEIAQRQRALKAWSQAEAFMKKRAKLKVPQTGRTWTRDELYEERLERIARRH